MVLDRSSKNGVTSATWFKFGCIAYPRPADYRQDGRETRIAQGALRRACPDEGRPRGEDLGQLMELILGNLIRALVPACNQAF